MITRSKISRIGCLLAGVTVLACGNVAAKDRAAEITVKAAIAHKIAKFVSWPDDRFEGQDMPLRFCVLGDQLTLDAFQELANRPIHGRLLEVLPAPDPLIVARSCDVLYFGEGDDRGSVDWLASVAGQPVLTFGEAGRYGEEGSIVKMTVRRNRVSFSINLEANENTGLRISAQLLQLAASVGSPGGA